MKNRKIFASLISFFILIGVCGIVAFNWNSELSGAEGKFSASLLEYAALIYHSSNSTSSLNAAENAIQEGEFDLAISKFESVKKHMQNIENIVFHIKSWALISSEPYTNMVNLSQNSEELANSIITESQKELVTQEKINLLADNLNALENLVFQTFENEQIRGLDYMTINIINNSSYAKHIINKHIFIEYLENIRG